MFEILEEKKECVINGRKGLEIRLYNEFPEYILLDKSLVGLEGEELKNALKKPFYLSDNLTVGVCWKGETSLFTIPKGYDWNGANVPPFCWLLIGQQKEPRFKLASCIHDYMCEHKDVIDYNRYLSTLVFEALCAYFGRFNAVKRWAMFHSVDNFQKLQGWGKVKRNASEL